MRLRILTQVLGKRGWAGRSFTGRALASTAIAIVLIWPRPWASGQPANRTPAKPQQSAKQPPASSASKPPVIDDEAARSKALLAHLNAVLRFYQHAEAPIQKVGEPSDLVYRNEVVSEITTLAGYAFQSAEAEARLMEPQGQMPANEASPANRYEQARVKAEQQVNALNAQHADLEKRLEAAPEKKRAALQQQIEQVDGELELQTAMVDALSKIASMGGASGGTGLAAQVTQLERSAPGVTAKKSTAVAPTLENFNSARNAGVVTQAKVLFDLLYTRQAIDNLAKEANGLHDQAVALQKPLVTLLKSTISQGQALSQNAAQAAAATNAENGTPSAAEGTSKAAPKKASAPVAAAMPSALSQYNDLTAKFKALSGAAVPLSQEILTLDQSHAAIQAWRAAVDDEYKSILGYLLTRVVSIAIALLVIFGLGEVWRRAAKRYVRDVRRRRQILVVRRLVMGFVTGLVLIFGFVTQFSSLATFAGFITAGIAVGLQTILLSVAAYFFIIGRYGIKVGDRISIGAVSGDVVEVGIVRFYVMEMAGSGTDLYATGRVAVFSNAVLFQAGTPLFKQMPGTQYAWHELTVKLSPDADYRGAVQEIVKALQGVYESYREQIERQHRKLELWMDSSVDMPGIQSNLLLVDGGLQFWVRFPVVIRQAAAMDEKMTEALLQLIAKDEKVKAAVAAPPVIKAAVKG
jgi:small-conductance mechanosensitive channel